ncbi:85/88 kDa calcium-independent phospholipase A2-like isoform X3 [Branchiostoma lanceolatum]|uniref:85/88 kDa calcium-independent phospholipase A2-like isoform X3 n=1 Tax=Branchiostoma lanceolatum TaxID=7740 RepID=UPI003451D87F
MSFFKDAVKGFVSNLVSDMPLLGTPYSIREVDTKNYGKYGIMKREDCLTLYRDERGQSFEAVLHNTGMSVQAYRVFRLPSEQEGVKTFQLYTQKLLPFYQYSKSVYSVTKLQNLNDLVQKHPSWSAAHLAVHLGMIECLKHNVVAGALNMVEEENGRTPLHLACLAGNLACIRELMHCNVQVEKADKEGNTAFHFAAQSNPEVLEMLCSTRSPAVSALNQAGESPLHVACRYNQPKCVQILLNVGANVLLMGAKGYPIHSAMEANSMECLDVLLEKDPRQVHTVDPQSGLTALHWARTPECIQLLLSKGARLEAVSTTGLTPLHYMVKEKLFTCVLAIMIANAEVNAKDQEGNSPLHLAVQTLLDKKTTEKVESGDIIRVLVVFGADLNAKNNKGETPRHIAAQSATGNKDIIVGMLHMVGAERCDASMTGCKDGCQHGRGFDGLPSPVAAALEKTHNRSKRARMDDILSLAVGASAIAAGYDQMDGPTTPSKYDKVLCLDGGGIRGLVLTQLLVAIEQFTGHPILDLFDWIGGTSTGGILALAIAHGKTARYCRCLYFRLKNEVFKGSRPYSSDALEGFLKEEYGENTKMTDVTHPKVIVTGVMGDRNPACLHLFRNYSPPDLPKHPENTKCIFQPVTLPSEQLVWRAARSSGAAPSYFRPMGRFLDGGLIANNPTLDVLTEIHEYNTSLRLKGSPEKARKLAVMVSLGTGRVPTVEVKSVDFFRPSGVFEAAKSLMGLKELGKMFVDLATDSDGRMVDRSRAWCEMIGLPFFRFNPPLSDELQLDETSDEHLIKMLWDTQVYINQKKDRFEKLAKILLEY